MNFIRQHLITKINEQIEYKQSVLKEQNFFWFDEPVLDGKRTFDRFKRFNPFVKNEVLPQSWYSLGGKALLESYKKIKLNQFYIYKSLDNKTNSKIRIKNK